MINALFLDFIRKTIFDFSLAVLYYSYCYAEVCGNASERAGGRAGDKTTTRMEGRQEANLNFPKFAVVKCICVPFCSVLFCSGRARPPAVFFRLCRRIPGGGGLTWWLVAARRGHCSRLHCDWYDLFHSETMPPPPPAFWPQEQEEQTLPTVGLKCAQSRKLLPHGFI